MTEPTEQLTEVQTKQALQAFEWLDELANRRDPLLEKDREQARIALRAWEEASRISANNRELVNVLAEDKENLKSSLSHCNHQYRRMAYALALLPETPVETIVETADQTNMERARWKFLLQDVERAAGCTSLAVTPDATHIVNRVQELAQAFDLRAHLERQRAWSEHTFGPGARPHGVIDHIRKELREIAENPEDLEEWIDVVILALDGAWRTGATSDQIIETLTGKQTKNEQRGWPDWRDMPADQAIEHERDSDPLDLSSPDDDLEWLEGIASSDADGATREAIINTVSRLRARLARLTDHPREESESTAASAYDRPVSIDQALIALGKYHAGYRPGTDDWTTEDDAALAAAAGTKQLNNGEVPLREMALQSIECWQSLYESEKERGRILCDLLQECCDEIATMAEDTRRSAEFPSDHDIARVTGLEDLKSRCHAACATYRESPSPDALRSAARLDEAHQIRKDVESIANPCANCGGAGGRWFEHVRQAPEWMTCVPCGGTGIRPNDGTDIQATGLTSVHQPYLAEHVDPVTEQAAQALCRLWGVYPFVPAGEDSNQLRNARGAIALWRQCAAAMERIGHGGVS